MSDVRIKSGELPRYFSFGTNSDGSKILTTTTIQASEWHLMESPFSTFQAFVTAAGSATIVIQGSNDGVNPVTINTITLTSGSLTDGFGALGAAWRYCRANVTAVSGTLTVIHGC